MKQLTLFFTLLILLAPIPTLAGGPKCEPPNPPDDYQPLCPEFYYAPPSLNPGPDAPSWPSNPIPNCSPYVSGAPPCNAFNVDKINDNSSTAISIIGGQPPYTWEIAPDSAGYWFDDRTTNTPSNTLNSDNYASCIAKIKVTDACGSEVSGELRNTRGYWSMMAMPDLNECKIPGPPHPDSLFGGGRGPFNAFRIEGKFRVTTSLVGGGCGSQYCNDHAPSQCVYGYAEWYCNNYNNYPPYHGWGMEGNNCVQRNDNGEIMGCACVGDNGVGSVTMWEWVCQ